MRKVEMITEINKIVGYEVIPAWYTYSYKEIFSIWKKLKTGNYTLEQRGYEFFIIRKESED